MHLDQCERKWLERSMASLREQSWPEWELCIADDATPEPWVSEFVQEQSESDFRIRYVRSAARMGAVSSLNRAGILSSGDYIAVLDQHDTLTPDALFHVVEALQSETHDVLYCDEDR